MFKRLSTLPTEYKRGKNLIAMTMRFTHLLYARVKLKITKDLLDCKVCQVTYNQSAMQHVKKGIQIKHIELQKERKER